MKQTLIKKIEGADLEINVVVEQRFTMYETNCDCIEPGSRFRDKDRSRKRNCSSRDEHTHLLQHLYYKNYHNICNMILKTVESGVGNNMFKPTVTELFK